jgi:hypothetical protein
MPVIGGSPSKTMEDRPSNQGGIARLRELKWIWLWLDPLLGSINHVLAGGLVAPATPGQVTNILRLFPSDGLLFLNPMVDESPTIREPSLSGPNAIRGYSHFYVRPVSFLSLALVNNLVDGEI